MCGSETCYLNWLEIIIDAFINMLSFCKLRNSLQYLLISVEFIGVIIVFFSGYELVYRYLLWVITSHALNYLLSLCAIVFEIAMELPFCIEMLKTKKLQIWTGFVKALSFFLCYVSCDIPQGQDAISYIWLPFCEAILEILDLIIDICLRDQFLSFWCF